MSLLILCIGIVILICILSVVVYLQLENVSKRLERNLQAFSNDTRSNINRMDTLVTSIAQLESRIVELESSKVAEESEVELPVALDTPPTYKTSFEDLRGKEYIDVDDNWKAVILRDSDNFPINAKLPYDLIDAIENDATMDRSVELYSKDEIQKKLDEYRIRVRGFKWNDKFEMPKLPLGDGEFTVEHLPASMFVEKDDFSEPVSYEKSILHALGEGNKLSLWYVDNKVLVEKLASNVMVYEHYKRTFTNDIPNGPQFIEWYKKATDEIMELKDPADINSWQRV